MMIDYSYNESWRVYKMILFHMAGSVIADLG